MRAKQAEKQLAEIAAAEEQAAVAATRAQRGPGRKFRSAGMPGCFRQTRNGETIEILIGDAIKGESPESSTWGDFE